MERKKGQLCVFVFFLIWRATEFFEFFFHIERTRRRCHVEKIFSESNGQVNVEWKERMDNFEFFRFFPYGAQPNFLNFFFISRGLEEGVMLKKFSRRAMVKLMLNGKKEWTILSFSVFFHMARNRI